MKTEFAMAFLLVTIKLPLPGIAAGPGKPLNRIFVLADDLRFDGLEFLVIIKLPRWELRTPGSTL